LCHFGGGRARRRRLRGRGAARARHPARDPQARSRPRDRQGAARRPVRRARRMRLNLSNDRGPMTIGQKLWHFSWFFLLLLCLIAGIGFAMLYSAANGAWDPWASRQAMRFAFGVLMTVAIALTDIRLWMRYSYVLYFLVL